MMRHAFTMIVILATFAVSGCAVGKDPCQMSWTELFTSGQSAPPPKKDGLSASDALEAKKKYDEYMSKMSEFEKCIVGKCGLKDKCPKDNKECLETYDTCVTNETASSKNTLIRGAFNWCFGIGWLQFIALLAFGWFLQRRFPGLQAWDQKGIMNKAIVFLWVPVFAFTLNGILPSSPIASKIVFGSILVVATPLFFLKVWQDYTTSRAVIGLNPISPDPPLLIQARSCPRCKAEVEEGDRFCGVCEGAMCPHCGAEVEAGDRFCGICEREIS